VSVEDEGVIVILDAGTGLRHAGIRFTRDPRPIHVLLTHLHMDHILGLGFFRPFFEAGRTVTIWGPPSTTQDLRTRLTRYLSPPLFPVRIRDLASQVQLHDAPARPWAIGEFQVCATTVIHPGPTLGYRLETAGRSMAYIPDHEPALGGMGRPRWTSGFDLARDVNVLIHDGQYSPEEYQARVGWGHSSVEHAAALAELAGVDRLVLFHHDPDHDDTVVEGLEAMARSLRVGGTVEAAREGMELEP
jgi:phosphoribosyl 1,2-cyclic phosphodiesterase